MELEAFEARCEPGENCKHELGNPSLHHALRTNSEMSVPVPQGCCCLLGWGFSYLSPHPSF